MAKKRKGRERGRKEERGRERNKQKKERETKGGRGISSYPAPFPRKKLVGLGFSKQAMVRPASPRIPTIRPGFLEDVNVDRGGPSSRELGPVIGCRLPFLGCCRRFSAVVFPRPPAAFWGGGSCH